MLQWQQHLARRQTAVPIRENARECIIHRRYL